MLTVNAAQIELMQKIARRIDRKLSFQLHHLADGSIEVKLMQGSRKGETRVSGAGDDGVPPVGADDHPSTCLE